MNTKEKRLTSLRINNNLYEFLKKEAIKSNRSFNNYIETILLDATGYSIPNSETISAMEELKNNPQIIELLETLGNNEKGKRRKDGHDKAKTGFSQCRIPACRHNGLYGMWRRQR